MKIIENEDVEIVMGSPPCTMYSQVQKLSEKVRTPGHPGREAARARYAKKFSEAEAHLKFCAFIYWMQDKRGKYYLHEHPRRASSWDTACMKKIEALTNNVKVRSDMCAFGMRGKNDFFVKKPTTFYTN